MATEADKLDEQKDLLGAPELPSIGEDTPEQKLETPAEHEPAEITEELTAPENQADDVTADVPQSDIDAIVETESNELLNKEDEEREIAAAMQSDAPKGLKGFLHRWWHNPLARYGSMAGFVAVVLALLLVPVTRYAVLNTVGVRVSASVVVIDNNSNLPLKAVPVVLEGKTAETDSDGRAKFSKLKLGKNTITINKKAFAPYSQKVTLGWGSNPLRDIKLTATGLRYSIYVKDWLSDKPLAGGVVVAGESQSPVYQDGKALLTLEATDTATKFKVTMDGYRTEEGTLPNDAAVAVNVKMVPARKHIFISNRSGSYDVYKVDIDGKNPEKLVPGTGNEQENITLAPHPKDDVTALVTTRDGKRNSDGYLLQSLYLVKNTNGELTKVVDSEQIQLVDWYGDRLVYVKIVEGASGNNPKRHRLISYNYKDGSEKELAVSNSFNDVLSGGGAVYYAPSNYFLTESDAFVYRINPDGTGKQTILKKEGWNLFRTDYDTIAISSEQKWYTYKMGDKEATEAKGAPAVLKTRLYVNNPDNTAAIRSEERDGKGVLLLRDIAAKTETAKVTKSGLQAPYYWLTDTYIVYRVSVQGQETADYVWSTAGGEAKKVTDVANISGIDRWYYY